MDPVESMRRTTSILIEFARQAGVDLSTCVEDLLFHAPGRHVFFWEDAGVLKYNLQGSIRDLPADFKNSASAFRGSWSEAGSVANVPEAVSLIKAWVLDRVEVDQLPARDRARYGIG